MKEWSQFQLKWNHENHKLIFFVDIKSKVKIKLNISISAYHKKRTFIFVCVRFPFGYLKNSTLDNLKNRKNQFNQITKPMQLQYDTEMMILIIALFGKPIRKCYILFFENYFEGIESFASPVCFKPS